MKPTLVFVFAAAFCIIGSDCTTKKSGISSVDIPDPDVVGTIIEMIVDIPSDDPPNRISVFETLRFPVVAFDTKNGPLTLNGTFEYLIFIVNRDYSVIDMTINKKTNRNTFEVIYKEVQVFGEYDLNIQVGQMFPTKLNGLIDNKVTNLRVNGCFTVGTNKFGGVLLSDVFTSVQLGNVLSEVLDAEYKGALGDFFTKFLQDGAIVFKKSIHEFVNEVTSISITERSKTMVYNVKLSDYLKQVLDANETCDAGGLPTKKPKTN